MSGVMLRTMTGNLKPGMTLATPVIHPQQPTQVLLKAGFTLTEASISRLRERRLTQVWVKYPGMGFLDQYVSDASCRAQTGVFAQVAATMERLQREATPRLDYPAYVDAVGTLVTQLMTNPSTAVFLGDIFEADDDLLRHSSTVTYLSLLLGLKLEYHLVRQRRHVRADRARDVTNLGLGAMLHDIGVLKLPEDVRLRYENTGDENDPAWREHPAMGFRFVRGNVDPTAAAVVLHHHQRTDGSGYAGEEFPVLSGESIHVFARIVAVADQFDRLRRPPNLPAQPAVFALRAMQDPNVAARFDPEVLAALHKVVPAYAPGADVVLSDGRCGVVVEPHSERPCRPTVQMWDGAARMNDPLAELDGPTLDLRNERPTLFVQRCDGVDVGDYNFELAAHTRRSAA